MVPLLLAGVAFAKVCTCMLLCTMHNAQCAYIYEVIISIKIFVVVVDAGGRCICLLRFAPEYKIDIVVVVA